jgi:hypothetical protein
VTSNINPPELKPFTRRAPTLIYKHWSSIWFTCTDYILILKKISNFK